MVSMQAAVVVKEVPNMVIMIVVLIVMLAGSTGDPLVHWQYLVLIRQFYLSHIVVLPRWFIWRRWSLNRIVLWVPQG
jgi:hypothetical protein